MSVRPAPGMIRLQKTPNASGRRCGPTSMEDSAVQTHPSRRLRPALILSAAAGMLLLLALAACGQGGGGGGGGGTEHTVTLEGFAFSPAELTIAVDDTVVFHNADNTNHTATHGENGEAADPAAFDLELTGGEQGDHTFEDAGEFRVTCEIHQDMNMTITVE